VRGGEKANVTWAVVRYSLATTGTSLICCYNIRNQVIKCTYDYHKTFAYDGICFVIISPLLLSFPFFLFIVHKLISSHG
jgi:hypothetical protein